MDCVGKLSEFHLSISNKSLCTSDGGFVYLTWLVGISGYGPWVVHSN